MSAIYGLVETPNPFIHQVRVPVPYPLQYVNAYLIAGDQGWTVVDPGIHTPDAIGLWEEIWRQLGGGYRNVERIVLTHHHPDHYGLAGYVQERSGAPVFLSERGLQQADQMWGADSTYAAEMRQLFLRHGMDQATADTMLPHMAGFVELVSPRPEVAVLHPGDRLRLGNREYETIETGGHAAGHFSFYQRESGEIFCGDAVLPRISPNISYMPQVEEDPLGEFIAGLRLLGQYSVSQAYPGHRDSFPAFSKRCEELVVHHEKRLNQMLAHVSEGPCTAYDCCTRLFGTRLTVHQLRFAMSETLAHLIHLEKKGILVQEERGGNQVFRQIAV